MRILKIGLMIFLLSLLSSFLFLKKEAIACEAITLTEFEEISSNVYSDSSLTNKQRLLLNNTINQAYNRVNQVYGETKSSPRIIATNDPKYKKFGLNPTGMQSSGFFRECIFLGPKGLNVE